MVEIVSLIQHLWFGKGALERNSTPDSFRVIINERNTALTYKITHALQGFKTGSIYKIFQSNGCNHRAVVSLQ